MLYASQFKPSPHNADNPVTKTVFLLLPPTNAQCFERNAEGMLKNMAIHELALAVSFCSDVPTKYR